MLTPTENEKAIVSLIDFGYAKKYKKGKKHIDSRTLLDRFQGNMLFGSYNQLKFHPTSRQDDLQSLLYLLFFLFNGQELPKLREFLRSKNVDETDTQSLFCGFKKYKKAYSLSKIFELTKFTQEDDELDKKIKDEFKHIVDYVSYLQFEDRPDYQSIKSILSNCQNLIMD